MRLQIFKQVVRHLRVKVVTGITAVNTVVAILIDVHIKLFPSLHQGLSIIEALHEVDIVVGRAMHQEQLAL